MKKIFGKLIACVMAVVVAMQFQVPTLAAGESKLYISDLIISYGEGDSAEADAKAWLTNNGYQVVDVDLNYGAESAASSSLVSWVTGARQARAVYLGYKTTTDVSQAITSVKAMNMYGNYSFADYEEVLETLEGEVKSLMDNLSFTLAEWRENYKAGRGKAIEVYYLLQLMYSPDNNNMKMGDLLLNETKEEMGDTAYDKLSDEEKINHADLTTILMQGNSDAIKYIEQLLAMGADTSTDSTWLDRLAASGTYDDMLDALEKEAEENDETFIVSVAEGKMAGMYDNAAMNLATSIKALQKLFKEYLESGTTLQDDENKINSFINKDSQVWSNQQWLSTGALYEALSQYKYPSADNPDRTLQEFFMEEFDPESEADREKLYPMAAALSDGQRIATAFVSVYELITQAIITDEEALKSANSFKGYLEENDSISVFAGVDRSIYDSSNTALTSAARELQNSSQKSYTEGVFGTFLSLRTVISAAVFAVSLDATILCAKAAKAYAHSDAVVGAVDTLEDKITDQLALSFDGTEEEFQDAVAQKMAEALIEADTAGEQGAVELVQGVEEANEYVINSGAAESGSVLYNAFKVATGVMIFVTIALGVWTVISGIADLQAYYNVDMDLYPIPDRMVDESENENGEKVYTYYSAVQCNRVEKGYTDGREALKDNADLNGDLGKQWLALYYTKDTNAGKPLTMYGTDGFQAISGNYSAPDGMTAVTLFGNVSPVNLTSEEWVWNDRVTDGLYLYYYPDAGYNAASVFSEANMWIVYAGGGVLIAVIFFFGGLVIGKKRKKVKAAEA